MDTTKSSTPAAETKPMSAIDRALAAAKARKATKAAMSTDDSGILVQDAPAADKTSKTPKAKVAKPAKDATAEAAAAAEKLAAKEAAKAARTAEREAKKAVELAAREERKATKEAAKAEKLAAKTAKKPAHMKKVDRARAKLPQMDEATTLSFNELVGNLTAVELHVLSLHLQIHNRASATVRAASLTPLPMGATVRITGGEPKFIGMVGEVVHSQKLRAKVAVSGVKNPVYIFTGEAEVVKAAKIKATA